MVIERLTYDGLAERYDVDIFTANQTGQDFSKASAKLKNHVYDYVVTDSEVEKRFVAGWTPAMRWSSTPSCPAVPDPDACRRLQPRLGNLLQGGSVRHIYFVAETKGTMSSMKLREIENTKIACARKFFDEIGRKVTDDKVKYDVVTDYAKLMDIVSRAA
jgi:type III restriction enzyme